MTTSIASSILAVTAFSWSWIPSIMHVSTRRFLAASLNSLKEGKEGGVFDDGKWVASHCAGYSSRLCQYPRHGSIALLSGHSALYSLRKGGGPGLWQFEVRYEIVVSAQPRQPYIQGYFVLSCHTFNFRSVEAGGIDRSVDSWYFVKRWKVFLY